MKLIKKENGLRILLADENMLLTKIYEKNENEKFFVKTIYLGIYDSESNYKEVKENDILIEKEKNNKNYIISYK